MKIAFVISETLCMDSFNGIRIQAQTWGEELQRQGHEVIYVSPWEKQKWESYDVIHLVGYSDYLAYLDNLITRNHNIVFSPIIDTKQNPFIYKLASYWGMSKLRLKSTNFIIRQARGHISHWYVRSKFEFQYVNKSYGVPADKITIIPLSYRITPPDTVNSKEHFCLHVSKLTDSRKNVLRLVKAAEKYKFELVLAGSISSEEHFKHIRAVVDRCSNIQYIGKVTDEELIRLYQRAKVFALPSINEGVGLAAVEAAVCGCDIVVTNVGGPKEYYSGWAYEINPYDIDDIGRSVLNAMKDGKSQPQLSMYVKEKYGLARCMNDLTNSYQKLIMRNSNKHFED